MAWRDTLAPSSYRGVPFFASGHEAGGGRRTAEHLFPGREDHYLEDLGRATRTYNISAYLVGPDYPAARDALIRALEAPGPGDLIHPYLGRVSVIAETYSVRERTHDGGYCEVAIQFRAAGRLLNPEPLPPSTPVPATMLAAESDAAFRARWSVSGRPDIVARSASNDMLLLGPAFTAARTRTILESPAGLSDSIRSIVIAMTVPGLLSLLASLSARSLSPVGAGGTADVIARNANALLTRVASAAMSQVAIAGEQSTAGRDAILAALPVIDDDGLLAQAQALAAAILPSDPAPLVRVALPAATPTAAAAWRWLGRADEEAMEAVSSVAPGIPGWIIPVEPSFVVARP